MSYAELFSTKKTPQSEAVVGKSQVKNYAGGYVFKLDGWKVLDRLLILGTDSPTYYASARKLTKEAAGAAIELIKKDGLRVVERTVEVSDGGLAPKNDSALFVLALCASFGNEATVGAVFSALPKVARTATHLFQYMEMIKQMRGWGRSVRKQIQNWYNAKNADSVAYQMVKYRNREGWTHKDALRVAHPKPASEAHQELYRWALGKGECTIKIVEGYEKMSKATDVAEVCSILKDYKSLPWETIPSQFLGDSSVWDILVHRLPMTALLRNLGRMTANGSLKDLGDNARLVVDRITDEEAVRNARIHPMSVLMASSVYHTGHGNRGNLTWRPVAVVADALEDTFYKAFRNVDPSNKKTMIALDVSGSMERPLFGTNLSARAASAAMAMVTVRTEPHYMAVAFTGSGTWRHDSSELSHLPISAKMGLRDVLANVDGLPFGPTDCSLPMRYATADNLEVETFVIYTDNETWHGGMHPFQALEEYRKKSGINAKLVVVGMTATDFTIADPSDAGMLDVVGFDASAPSVIANFVRD